MRVVLETCGPRAFGLSERDDLSQQRRRLLASSGDGHRPESPPGRRQIRGRSRMFTFVLAMGMAVTALGIDARAAGVP